MAGAGPAEHVSRPPRQQLVLLEDLKESTPILALPAATADGAPVVGNLCADNVAAVVVVHEADALAGATLRAAADTNLVELAALAAAGDEPLAGAQVLKLFAVGLEETMAAKDVIRCGFGVGLVRWVRDNGLGHWGSFPLVRASGC